MLTRQSVFLIDLPRKTAGSKDSKVPFYEELVYFLKASTVNENIIAKLGNFDFSQTTHIAFVHTMWVLFAFARLIWTVLILAAADHTEGIHGNGQGIVDWDEL